MKRLQTLFLSMLLTSAGGPAAWANPEDLPDIGSPADAALTLEDEYKIGRMIVRGLRDSDRILEDPEITAYVQGLGSQLGSLAHEGSQQFDFFVVKDNGINAFALPGGFIGLNSGLILETRNENELAGVVAHEVAHVTQRHIARSVAAQSRQSLVSTAAMLAALLIGAAVGGGEAAMAGVSAAQSVAIQQRVAFTRSNELEADRIGIGILAGAGYDPRGMSDFFETMSRRYGSMEQQIPEMLRSHPVSTDRIAEARARSAQMELHPRQDSLGYSLTRERLRVLSTAPGRNPTEYYEAIIRNEPDASEAEIYGQALARMVSGEPAEAARTFRRLRDANQTVLHYHTALGQAQLLAGDGAGSLQTLSKASELFPRNVPVTIRLAETLLQLGEAKRAHEILLDLFNNVPPTPEQARFIALVANAAGDVGDAYYYMSEYHILGGDLALAVNQLQLALGVPGLTEVQRARFQARLEEIQKYLPKRGNGDRSTNRSARTN